MLGCTENPHNAFEVANNYSRLHTVRPYKLFLKDINSQKRSIYAVFYHKVITSN